MTTIAWHGASRTLAADRLHARGELAGFGVKIWRTCRGELVGGSGDAAFIGEMREWVEHGRNKADFPAAQRGENWQTVLVIELDGTVSLYEQSHVPVRYLDENFAIGSGKQYATVAMYLGQGAVQAVTTAMAFDPGTGGTIDSLVLGS